MFAEVDSSRARQRGLTFRPVRDTIANTLAWAIVRSDRTRVNGLSPERETDLLARWLVMTRDEGHM